VLTAGERSPSSVLEDRPMYVCALEGVEEAEPDDDEAERPVD